MAKPLDPDLEILLPSVGQVSIKIFCTLNIQLSGFTDLAILSM